jgi:hypothetical protein
MPASPAVAHLRLAFDLSNVDPNTLAVTGDGAPVPVTDEGFVELPLTVGELHKLAAQATSGGNAVRWECSLLPALNTESEPIFAELK